MESPLRVPAEAGVESRAEREGAQAARRAEPPAAQPLPARNLQHRLEQEPAAAAAAGDSAGAGRVRGSYGTRRTRTGLPAAGNGGVGSGSPRSAHVAATAATAYDAATAVIDNIENFVLTRRIKNGEMITIYKRGDILIGKVFRNIHGEFIEENFDSQYPYSVLFRFRNLLKRHLLNILRYDQ